VVQNQLPCLLDVELGELLRGYVQLAGEHYDHPRLVLDQLFSVRGRGRGPCPLTRSGTGL
jgi:hypothetical protein